MSVPAFIDKDVAIAALEAAAYETRDLVSEEETRDGDLITETTVYRVRRVVHSFGRGTGMLLGADHEIGGAIDRVKAADELAWVTGPAGHDLAVRVDDYVYYYAVKRPT